MAPANYARRVPWPSSLADYRCRAAWQLPSELIWPIALATITLVDYLGSPGRYGASATRQNSGDPLLKRP